MCNMLMLCIDCCTKQNFLALCYFLMSLVSCQWIRPQRKSIGPKFIIGLVYNAIIAIPVVAINIYPLVMFIIGWAECPYTHSSICYTLQFHFGENKSIPKLVLRDIPKGIIEHNPTNST